MAEFKAVPYGFIDRFGHKWWRSQVDLYNKIGADMLKYQKLGRPVPERTRNALEATYMVAHLKWLTENKSAVR